MSANPAVRRQYSIVVLSGKDVARAIIDGDDTWRRFIPFELVWSGGVIGRTAAQVHYWWYRFNERSRARQARRREAEYRRSEGELPGDSGAKDSRAPERHAT